MSTPNQFLLALNAYNEIRAELHPGQPSQTLPPEIPIPEMKLPQAAALPGGSLMLGMAEDGLPVLLDLYDPAPGPLLVAGDGGSGKTHFLQSLARASDFQDPGDIQFGVLTPFPEEWSELESLPQCLGVWPAYHPSARDFVAQLVNWAEALSDTRQAVLLLFDGFDLMTGSDFQYQHDLRWLLTYGPERHIWPVVTINPARLNHLQPWLEYFHTHVFGQVKHIHNTRLLVDGPELGLADLLPGAQYGLSRLDSWIKFWLPPID